MQYPCGCVLLSLRFGTVVHMSKVRCSTNNPQLMKYEARQFHFLFLHPQCFAVWIPEWKFSPHVLWSSSKSAKFLTALLSRRLCWLFFFFFFLRCSGNVNVFWFPVDVFLYEILLWKSVVKISVVIFAPSNVWQFFYIQETIIYRSVKKSAVFSIQLMGIDSEPTLPFFLSFRPFWSKHYDNCPKLYPAGQALLFYLGNVLAPRKCKLQMNKLICFQFCSLSSHCLCLSFLSPQRGSSVGHSWVRCLFKSADRGSDPLIPESLAFPAFSYSYNLN